MLPYLDEFMVDIYMASSMKKSQTPKTRIWDLFMGF